MSVQCPPAPFELSRLDRSNPGEQVPPREQRHSQSCAGLSTTVPVALARRGGFFGRRLGEYFGGEAAELLEMNWHGNPAVVVTRLTCSRPDRLGGGLISPEPALSIFHQLADAECTPVGPDARPSFHGLPGAGEVHVMDLRQDTKCELTGPVDLLHYYVPCQALVDAAREYTRSPVQTLSFECARPDPVLPMLSALLLRAAVREERAERGLFVEQLTFSVLAYFAERYGGLRAHDCVVKNGLAPWQERRSKEMMRASIGSDLSIAAVAAACRLTPNHFGRCFKRSTGDTPYQYLTRLRLEEAKRLMLTAQHTLAEIALACGFGDQSHFTRIFSRNVGMSPAAWRRARFQG
jgi:AraC family transcriptional regulator